ncbi:MAG: hypothetical protein ABH950_03480 [Candidatus Altiarchaeota archaeon]
MPIEKSSTLRDPQQRAIINLQSQIRRLITRGDRSKFGLSEKLVSLVGKDELEQSFSQLALEYAIFGIGVIQDFRGGRLIRYLSGENSTKPGIYTERSMDKLPKRLTEKTIDEASQEFAIHLAGKQELIVTTTENSTTAIKPIFPATIIIAALTSFGHKEYTDYIHLLAAANRQRQADQSRDLPRQKEF